MLPAMSWFKPFGSVFRGQLATHFALHVFDCPCIL